MQQERLYPRSALLATVEADANDQAVAVVFHAVSSSGVVKAIVVHLAGPGANDGELRALGQAVWAGLQ